MDVAEITGRLIEHLDCFKSQDSAVATYPLIDDEKLILFVSSWRVLKAAWNFENVQESDVLSFHTWDEIQLWNWMWEHCEWDVYQIARMCHVSTTEAWLLFDKAKGFRFIYPDGSIAVSAEAAIMGFIIIDAAEKERTKEKLLKKPGKKKRYGFDDDDDFDA